MSELGERVARAARTASEEMRQLLEATSSERRQVVGAQKFRKKPVEIEAMKWDGTAEGATLVIDWVLGGGGTARYYTPGEWDQGFPVRRWIGGGPYLAIDTLEGRMLADPHCWIIRGVAGEFYPCKPDVFAETYEAVITQAP